MRGKDATPRRRIARASKATRRGRIVRAAFSTVEPSTAPEEELVPLSGPLADRVVPVESGRSTGWFDAPVETSAAAKLVAAAHTFDVRAAASSSRLGVRPLSTTTIVTRRINSPVRIRAEME